MKLLCIISIIINVMIFIGMSVEQNYSRAMMEAKYPGFGTAWIPLYEDDGSITIGYFNESDEYLSRSMFFPNPEDLVYTLYTREGPPNGTIIDKEKKNLGQFNSTKPTKFITHGWMSSGTSEMCTLIKNGFLDKYDANVFVMDWSIISKNVIYFIPMGKTTDIGKWYSTFLNYLIEKHGGDPKSFHLVGHSLGAHVSGFAARNVSGKIGRLTALDPARPGFEGSKEDDRLLKSDADFVDVIHTCAGYLGLKRPLGHVDFYPNGGIPPQPGCKATLQIKAKFFYLTIEDFS